MNRTSVTDAMPRDTVCFDLDGTLLDPAGSIRATIDRIVQEQGLAPFRTDEVLIGMPLRDILRLRIQDRDAIEAMVTRYRELYTGDAWRQIRFFPGMEDLLADLRADGVRTAVVTTKGEQEAITVLGAMDRLHLFDTVVGDDDVRPLKPDPAPVIAACGRLGRHPRDGCMVGDTVYDIEAGRRAGAWTIGVAWGHGSHASMGAAGADVLVSDCTELAKAIAMWRADRHKE